jgi:demethylmenaquinone methyltransferase/2-methoxy-6-polyprenyl-1,4-benzoquinol methylase
MNKFKKDSAHTEHVDNLFSSIYRKYDLMNDVMSLGSHRFYKKQAMKHCQKGNLLDLAAGTGDLAIYFRKQFGTENMITLVEPNSEMLNYAKLRLVKKYIFDNIKYITAYAENLPFEANTFDNVSIGFGLRNFTDKEKSLLEIKRVLKPKGRLVIIDFSHPTNFIIRYLNSIYLKYCVPFFAKIFTGDTNEYKYLAKSIKQHPSQNEITTLLDGVGFNNCIYKNKLNGIITVHTAIK